MLMLNINFIKLSDAFLPKLLSGELNVNKAEKKMEGGSSTGGTELLLRDLKSE